MSTEQSAEDFIPEYYEVSDMLVAEDSLAVSAAEVHGLLCGYLAAGSRIQSQAWLQLASELMDITEFRYESSTQLLVDLYEGVLSQLQNADFGFQLLLPDDESPMPERAEALGVWCQGFLSGFGLQGGYTNETLSDELKETLGDVEQIAQLELDPEDDDESEAAFMELQEYVRMAAMMLFSECNPPLAADTAEPGTTLH